MATLSVAVPDDLRKKIQELEEVNWSAVARRAFEEKVRQVEMMKEITSKSKLTEKDAKEISKRINAEMSRKFKAMRA